MKKILTKVTSLAMAMVLAATATGCSQSANSQGGTITVNDSEKKETADPASEKIEIRLMTPWTAGAVAYEQIEALIERYKVDYPNITLIHDALSTADARTKLTVEMAAGNPPDVSWCPVNYAREFIKDGKIIDWTEVYEDPAHPEFKEWFSEVSLNSAQNAKGQIMLAPQEGSIDALYYNAEMFEQYGWEPPKTFDDLLALIPKTNAEGIATLVTGGKDSRFAWLASALLIRTAGLENFNSLCLGDDLTNWNNPDLGFVTAVEKFKQFVEAGGYPKGVLGMSATEADQMFATGKAAMYYEGAWKPGNFLSAGGDEFIGKVRRINFPAMTDTTSGNTNINVGGNVTGFFVAEGLSEAKKQACIQLVKDIASPEFNIPIMEKGAFVYAGKADYDKEKVSNVMNQLIEAYRSAEGFIPSMDTIAPPAVDLAIKQTAMPGIITGEYDVQKAVAEVQKAAEDYATSLKQ